MFQFLKQGTMEPQQRRLGAHDLGDLYLPSTMWAKSRHLRASLVTQTAKNLLAMQETQAQSLGWEDPLEKGKSILSSILA